MPPRLEFTPLEFETRAKDIDNAVAHLIRIYSVGVWNLICSISILDEPVIRIYSVGVWNLLEKTRLKRETKPLEFTPLEFETAICS